MKKSLVLYTNLNDPFYIAKVADFMGSNYAPLGQFDRLAELSQQSYELRRKIGDEFGSALSLTNLQEGALLAGDYNKLTGYLRETDGIYSRLGSQAGIARNKTFWAWLTFYQGDFDQTQELSEAALNSSLDALNGGTKQAVITLSLAGSMKGDHAKGQQLQQNKNNHGWFNWFLFGHHAKAVTACGLGDYQTAAHWLSMILREGMSTYKHASIIGALPIAAILLAHEGDKEQATAVMALAFTEYGSMAGWLEKWPLFKQLRSDLEANLGSEAFAAVWERGNVSDLQNIIHSLIERFNDNANQFSPVSHISFADPLSGREQEVLHLIAEGLTNAEIAAKLYLSLGTVKVHVRNIFTKFNVNNRTQALARAKALHLL